MIRILILFILSINFSLINVVAQNRRWSDIISQYTSVPSATYDKIYIDTARCMYGDCKNGYGEIARIDGSIVYKGLFHDGQYNGFGLLIIKENSRQAIFSGNFFNGSLNGKGFYIAANGDHFNGIFIDGQRAGIGRINFSDGGAYEGSFDDKGYVGYGTYYNRNGNIYTGTFYPLDEFGVNMPFNWYINGFGTMKYMDDSVYLGFWQAGKRHGYGTVLFKDKVLKRGFWKNGAYKGDVNVTYIENLIGDYRSNYKEEIVKYEEEIVANNIGPRYKNYTVRVPKAYRTALLNGKCVAGDCNNGYGIKRNNDKTIIYEGTFVGGMYQGYGFLNYRGTRYYGFFDKGSLTGEGMSIRREPPEPPYNEKSTGFTNVYTGSFIDGERVGYGKMLFAENAFYEGSFLDDAANGNGTLYRIDGSLYVGELSQISVGGVPWEEDPLDSGNKAPFHQTNPYKWVHFSGFGILKYRNDSTYIGNWSFGQREGIGKLIKSKNGKIAVSGLWKANKFEKRITKLNAEEKRIYGITTK